MQKRTKYQKTKKRVRSGMVGTKTMPRLCVTRSAKHISAQLIDDTSAKTLASFSSLNLKNEERSGKTKSEIAAIVGENLAQKAAKIKVKKVIFDRGAFRFHGRIKALAEGAKKGGITI